MPSQADIDRLADTDRALDKIGELIRDDMQQMAIGMGNELDDMHGHHKAICSCRVVPSRHNRLERVNKKLQKKGTEEK